MVCFTHKRCYRNVKTSFLHYTRVLYMDYTVSVFGLCGYCGTTVSKLHSATLDRGTETKSMHLLVCKYTFLIAEEELRSRVKRKLPEFIELTNWEYLVPHLVSVDLSDPATTDYLLNETRTEHQKGVYFYVKVLPSKGPDAYTQFYKCLCDEKKHSGHKSLVQICNN